MTVLQICQDNKLDFYDLMEAVEEFVDGFYDSPQIEIYEATAKKLLGATLSHDEIMMETPFCTPNDLLLIEKAPNSFKFQVATDTYIKTMLTKIKIGRHGLEQLMTEYDKLIARDKKSPEYTMAQVAGMFGLDVKSVQILITKMLKHRGIKEDMMRFADEILSEEVPTNTSGGAMPNHEPTDGAPCKKKLAKRKRFSEYQKDLD